MSSLPSTEGDHSANSACTKCGGDPEFCLQAGDGLPDTLVDAHAEPDMARGVAPDVEGVRVGPVPRVAVGSTEKQQHLLPGWEAYPGDLSFGLGSPAISAKFRPYFSSIS